MSTKKRQKAPRHLLRLIVTTVAAMPCERGCAQKPGSPQLCAPCVSVQLLGDRVVTVPRRYRR